MFLHRLSISAVFYNPYLTASFSSDLDRLPTSTRMSSPQDIPGLVDQLRVIVIITCVEASVLALFLYDFSLTFFREVDLVWRRKFGLPTALFLMSRYLILFGLVYNIAGSPSQSLCVYYLLFNNILARASITAVSIARTYAIYDKNPIVLVLLSTLGLIFIVIDCINARNSSCTASFDPQDTTILFNILMSGLRVLFDMTVMGLTVYKTFRSIRCQKILKIRGRRSLASQILTDGTFYFLSVFLLEFLNTSFSVLGSDGLKEVATAYVLPVQSLLTTRFLLNLREVTLHSKVSSEDITTAFSTLHPSFPRAQIPTPGYFEHNALKEIAQESQCDLLPVDSIFQTSIKPPMRGYVGNDGKSSLNVEMRVVPFSRV